ncbi:MAG: phosphopantetheine adenylyltransferase [Nevskiales bacterium]
MSKAIAALLLVAGAFNLYSLIGVFGPDSLAALYGIRIEETNLLILMRHRAVLFGLLGGFLMIAAFRPVLQPAAIIAGLVSMLSIIALALGSGGYNPLLYRIVVVDSILSLGLLLALVLRVLQPAVHEPIAQ